MKSRIIFGDEKLQKEYEKIKDDRLKDQIKKALETLEVDTFSGIQIPKKLIPKEYSLRYGNLTNLWKYNLPGAWRLIYTIKGSEIEVLSVLLEWMDHKEYERRFKY